MVTPTPGLQDAGQPMPGPCMHCGRRARHAGLLVAGVALVTVSCGRLGFDDAADSGSADSGRSVDAASMADAALAWQLGPVLAVTDTATDSDEPDILANEQGFALAWHDSRTGNEEIFFIRLDADGDPLMEAAQISNTAGDSRKATLAYAGGEYGVAWQDDTNGWIEFSRFTPDGTVLSYSQVSEGSAAVGEARLIWNGSEYVLFWEDDRLGAIHIFRARLDASGNLVEPPAVLTETETAPTGALSAVPIEAGISIVWQDFRADSNLFYARLDELGHGMQPEVQLTATPLPTRSPALAALGDGLRVVFEDDRGGHRDIWTLAADLTGSTAGEPVQLSSTAQETAYPRIAARGRDYAAVWQEGPQADNAEGAIHCLIVNSDDEQVFAQVVAEAPEAKQPSVAADARGYAIAWDDVRGVGGDIFFARLTPEPVP